MLDHSLTKCCLWKNKVLLVYDAIPFGLLYCALAYNVISAMQGQIWVVSWFTNKLPKAAMLFPSKLHANFPSFDFPLKRNFIISRDIGSVSITECLLTTQYLYWCSHRCVCYSGIGNAEVWRKMSGKRLYAHAWVSFVKAEIVLSCVPPHGGVGKAD